MSVDGVFLVFSFFGVLTSAERREGRSIRDQKGDLGGRKHHSVFSEVLEVLGAELPAPQLCGASPRAPEEYCKSNKDF